MSHAIVNTTHLMFFLYALGEGERGCGGVVGWSSGTGELGGCMTWRSVVSNPVGEEVVGSPLCCDVTHGCASTPTCRPVYAGEEIT
ncbi:hypothetical protein Pmani_008190 [Petrolisthes manimaculis]|uniref:Secreted protein n=1 Tax=Petrolisthes manimaculis TaxID=1843537 RepID=A0AAE1Q7G8_9EUCA|nr:hypothetical protein Pmani_008190 [Petrolisthes manimaculis]